MPISGGDVGKLLEQAASGDGLSPASVLALATYIADSGGPVDATGKPQLQGLSSLKSYQGKAVNGSNANITATVAGDTALVYGSAPKTLYPGAKVRLSVGAGQPLETVIVSNTYVVSATATSIPLADPVVNSGSTTAKWDVYGVNGPGPNAASLDDLIPLVLMLVDGANSNSVLSAVNAASDGQSVSRLLMSAIGLYNGTTADRWRGQGGAAFISAFCTTSTPTTVAANVASVQLLAANTSRKAMSIVNTGAANLFLGFGNTPTTTSYKYKIAPSGVYDSPLTVFQGIVNGIWDVASGNAQISEEI
jgi:hypothetical protein